MRFDLNGTWELFPIPLENSISDPAELGAFTPLQGNVPGNIELDLWQAGLGGDPFIGENAKAYSEYEEHDFWYRRTFSTGFTGECQLVLEGADCFTGIFLNGQLIGSSENALMPHRFPVVLQEENTLAIRIKSAEIAARKYPPVSGTLAHFAAVYSSVYTRKPAHVTGWDILPRLCLGGLWRDVYIEKDDSPFRFDDVWVQTMSIDREEDTATLRMFYAFQAGNSSLRGCTLRFSGQCGDSSFCEESPAYFTNGTINFTLTAPKLWFPREYGEANLYQLHAELLDKNGNILADYHTVFGIRTILLDRSDEIVDGHGRFSFIVNGQPVRVRGSNHVPADALHSRDRQRIDKILSLYEELGCNMIRCWGGSVYECDEFYDWCDEHGVLVWQDFMFACGYYPQNETFFSLIRPEAEAAVKRLRRHPSLALWCGDNECDQSSFYEGLPLKFNRLNREILPSIVAMHDPSRPYIASSPYIKAELQDKYTFAEVVERIPELHLWGNRETFKLPYYADIRCSFISESGWIGTPSLATMRQYLTPEHFKLDENDPEWDFHSCNPFGPDSVLKYRRTAIGKSLQEYFGNQPDNLADYVRASQIFQAEALKFLVETVRLSKCCTGLIWWNMIDGWPQISDAVVDYYFRKKLAFHYIKRSQTPFCICCTEPDPWESRLIALNDTCRTVTGTFTACGENGEIIKGTYELPPFSRKDLGSFRAKRGDNALWLIQWDGSEGKGSNHYIAGNLRMELPWYMERLKKIAGLDDSFNTNIFD